MEEEREREIGQGENTGDDAKRVEIERGEDGREEGKERKRRHIENNEGEGYVCVALSA